MISYDETVEVSQNGSYQIRCKWLGVLPLKTIKGSYGGKAGSAGQRVACGDLYGDERCSVIDSGEITDQEESAGHRQNILSSREIISVRSMGKYLQGESSCFSW